MHVITSEFFIISTALLPLVCLKVASQKYLLISAIPLLSSGRNHRAAKHTNLLTAEYLCLAKTGYQPNCHLMNIASGWFSAKFCLADKFAKQYFLLCTFLK